MNYIVMPCHNAVSLTMQAVESCLAQDIETAVFALNDASTDGTAQYLDSQDRVMSVHFTHPKGVSYLWNVALRWAFDKLGLPHVLVVNTDVILRPDTYRRLIEDGGQFVTCVGTSSGALFPGGEPSGSKRPHPDFSCFLIRKECWDKVGPFDADMKIYASDGDMHLRMHQAGIEAYCLDLPFFHVASGTIKNTSPEDKERIEKQAGLDRAVFEKKWGVVMGSPEYYAMFKESDAAAVGH